MDDSQPVVSVILPSYNHCQYVAKAIESVLAQSLQDFELLIIDDASTDGSQEVIRAYSDPRIFFWSKEVNSGTAKTINQGIKQARGKYVCILNSDDLFVPERLELLFNDCEKKGIEFAVTDIELINGEGVPILDKGHWWLEWFESLKDNYVSTQDIFQGLLLGNFFITTSNFFIYKKVFNQIGYFFDYKFVSDYEFILRFLDYKPQAIKFWLGQKLLYYRLHETNTIKKNPILANKETCEILLRWFPEYLDWKDRVRFQSLAKQLNKCLGHVEQLTSLSWQEKLDNNLKHQEQKLQNYQEMLRERDRQLEDKEIYNQRLTQEFQDVRQQMQKLLIWTHTVFSEEVYGSLPFQDIDDMEITETIQAYWKLIEVLSQRADYYKCLVQEKEQQINQIQRSVSYRLGLALLHPVRWLKTLLTGCRLK